MTASRYPRILALLLAIAFAVAIAAPGFALDRAKTAVSMAQQAGSAYESGSYARAAELYRNAYQTDPEPPYLYGAARSEHLAGNKAAAIELYRKYLKAGDGDSTRTMNAAEFLADIEVGAVTNKVTEAEKAERAGQPAVAMALYDDAYRRDHGRPDLLYRAAVAAQDSGDKAAAIDRLHAYLAASPAAAADRDAARARLTALGAAATASDDGLRVGAAPSGSGHGARTAAFVTLGAGVVGGAAGLTLMALGGSASHDANALPIGQQADIDRYHADYGRAQNLWRAVVALGAVGVVGAGVGTFLLVRANGRDVAVSPLSGASGLQISGAF